MRKLRLKIWNSSECAGSSPASGTILMLQEEVLKMDIEIIRAFKNIEDKLEELKNRNFSDENLKELFNYLEDWDKKYDLKLFKLMGNFEIKKYENFDEMEEAWKDTVEDFKTLINALFQRK